MIENKFERCEPDDPNRCQATGKHGQCPFKAKRKTEDTFYQFCPRHLASAEYNEEKRRVRNYRLNKFQARIEEFADNDQVKSLREEIGISRMMLEEILNKCQDTDDLIMASNKISEMVMKIEKLVSSCHKLEHATGMLLDKTTLMKLADKIVEIIGTTIEDEAVVTTIAVSIVQAVSQIQNERIS